MKYCSTRGGVTGASFEDALFSGYALDGGLYVPESLPSISAELLSKWKASPPRYQEVVLEVVKLFVGEDELPRDKLQQCVDQAYAKFDSEQVLEIHNCKVSQQEGSSEYKVVEMYHGQTKSFKDYALSLVGKLMEYYVQKNGSHVTVLVGTSGDTGSAAIDAVRGLDGVDIIVLYPKGKISKVQELQLITFLEENVHVFHVEGTSDDTDVPIKKCFPAPGLISINSINWARVMIQIAHYVYISAIEKFKPVDIYVPTGGGGNLSSGLVASLLGFPINLYSSQTVNDNVEKLINKGELLMGGDVTETYANAMDIRNPYNVERLLYFSSDAETVSKIMKASETQTVVIPSEVHAKLRTRVKGALKVDDSSTLQTIRKCWAANKYLICPHTATAVTYFLQRNEEGVKSENQAYVISTASPKKFPDAAEAANIDCNDLPNSPRFALLHELMTREVKQPKEMKVGEDWYKILKAEIEQINQKYLLSKK